MTGPLSFNESDDREDVIVDDVGSFKSMILTFRGVDFQLSRFKVREDTILKGIPHFRFNENGNLLSKCFDLEEIWLLECVEKGRVVSEATGRLLLGTLIQNGSNLAGFVRIGEVKISEKYLGFRRINGISEYFETFVDIQSEFQDDFSVVSAQIVLEWLPNNLRVGYPGFSGYFDSWHPIEKIVVRCVWPQIPREGIKFVREELQAAPILIAEYEEAEEKVSLRNTTLRAIQAGHLREVLFTSMGKMPLISLPVAQKEIFKEKEIESLNSLYEAMAAVYKAETEKMETDLTFKYNFIPKRVLEAMRWERLNETFSLLWRRFMKSVEKKWNDLIKSEFDRESESKGEIEKSLKLINWCIERELEWQGALKDHVLLRKLYKIPDRYKYQSKTIDDKIEELGEKMASDLKGISEALEAESDADELVESEEFVDCIEDIASNSTTDHHDNVPVRKVLEHGYDLKGHVVYEPVVLNCEPPPSKLLTKSLLNNPLAGDVIALNQLKEDMRVFKAWNEEICGKGCLMDEEGVVVVWVEGEGTMDLGFIGFLLWHSPNDIEPVEGGGVRVSQRMRDAEGQWLEMWTTPADSHESLNKQVSFNHRAMLGQVMSDLMLKVDLNQLLEAATPTLTRKAAELMGEEAEEILRHIEAEAVDGQYPLDKINEELDAYELVRSKSLVLQAMCSNVFKEEGMKRVLVAGEAERTFLLNKQHEFKVTKKEVVSKDGGGFRELVGKYEGIVAKLSY